MKLTRRQMIAGAVVTGAGGLVAMRAVTAGPDPQVLIAGFIRQERRWNRLGDVVGNPGLQAQAELQAARMAAGRTLFHTPQGELDWWVNPTRPGALNWIGEIVGTVGDASEAGLLELNRAWIRSPGHRAVMLHPAARLLGVGVRGAGGTTWASAVFGY